MFVGQSWKVVTKQLFHDANSKRGGVLMHSKVGASRTDTNAVCVLNV